MITIQEIPQIRPPSISISLAQVSVSPDWQAVVCMKFLQWLLGHYAVWWKMGTVSWSASYINRTGKLFFFFYSTKWWRKIARWERWSGRVCVSECPLFRQMLIKQRQARLRGWEANPSITPQPIHFHLRKLSVTWGGAAMARLSPERERVTGRGRDWAGGSEEEKWFGMLEGDELPLPVAGIVIVWLQGTLLN